MLFTFLTIMSRDTLLGMLRLGNTGSEILQILDAIAADNDGGQDNSGAPANDAWVSTPMQY